MVQNGPSEKKAEKKARPPLLIVKGEESKPTLPLARIAGVLLLVFAVGGVWLWRRSEQKRALHASAQPDGNIDPDEYVKEMMRRSKSDGTKELDKLEDKVPE